MPQADIPFIIGVIREKEKGLLEADEYTRIQGAASAAETAHALSDTSYGIHLAGATNPMAAILARLVDEFEWLVDVLGADHAATIFIAARFDALHVAAALIDIHEGRERERHARSLGTMSAELITSCLRENVGWESVPAAWRAFLRRELVRLSDTNWTKTATIERTGQHTLRVMEEHSPSELGAGIVALMRKRLIKEKAIRPGSLPDDLIAFERAWDEQLLELLRPWKSDATSINAVLAWWYALTIEAKTLRLVVSAKMSGFPADTLQSLRRTFYRSWV